MHKRRATVALLGLTLVLCVLPFLLGGAVRLANPAPPATPAVQVYNAQGDRWVSWKSEEAVKFSLDQVVATIRYLFTAAAAGIAFVGKIVIEPRVTSTTTRPLSDLVLYLLLTAVSLWLGSLTCGMLAHLYLAGIGTAETFTIYGTVGVNVLFQLLYFALGLALFLVALIQSI